MAFNYADYYITIGEKKLKQTTTTRDGVTTTANYYYGNNIHIQPTREITYNSKGEKLTTFLKYPHDFSTSPYTAMVNKHIYAPVIEQLDYNGTTYLQKHRTEYQQWSANIIAPSQVTITKSNGESESPITFNYYDDRGNVLSLVRDGQSNYECYVWGYNKTYPIAKIKTASYTLYSTILAVLGGSAAVNTFCNTAYPTDAEVKTFLAPLHTDTRLKNAQVTTYTYKPLVGMTSATEPNGVITHYDYDDFGRLWRIRDDSGRILKTYEYHYKQ
jgi:YD repeat-containing protein